MRKTVHLLLAAGVTLASMLPVASANAFTTGRAGPSDAASSDVVQVAQQKPVAQKYHDHIILLVGGSTRYDHRRYQQQISLSIEGDNRATRYGIGVGRDGFGWSGVVKVGRKAEWPGWTPPPEMRVREAKKGHKLPTFQEGGEDNPLGARAMYLYHNGHDTAFRIHGTNQPWTIGLNMSSGCIRMMNKDVEHLYDRAAGRHQGHRRRPRQRRAVISFEDRGIDVLRTMFGSFGG